MLITKNEINTLAFLTPLDTDYFKTNIMYSIEDKNLQDVLGTSLFDQVNASPTDFPILIESYIKPFLAFKNKYFVLHLLSSELSIDAAYTNIEDAIEQADLVCRQNLSLLRDYIYNTYGIAPSSISGFTIPQTIIESFINTETMPTTDVEDIAPSLFTANTAQTAFALPQLLKRSSLVFVNDSFIDPSKYLGIGTLTLTFLTALNKYDKVLVTF